MLQVRQILVPIDFTDPSDRAVDVAAIMAKQFKAKLWLVHVIEQFTYSVTDTVQVVDHYMALKTIAQPLLQIRHQRLLKKGLTVRTLLTRGNIAGEIVGQAKKNRVDLIVMGSHGRTGIRRLLLGSVAERVVRLASCSVLIVRGAQKRRARKKTKRS